jgi:rSAM/selenodomain-associated transferase 1
MGDAAEAYMRRRLIMMVREPVAGRVKTRLAREAGTVAALRFYRAASANLIRRLGNDPRWRLVLAVSPDSAVHSRSWPASIARIPQGTGDLGDRMGRLLRQRGARATIIIGSDIPAIRPAHIAEAFRKLGSADAVFGPAEDGGYWLAGAKPHRAAPAMFRNVRWSSPHALGDTLANLEGLRVAFGETLGDVDDAASLRKIGQLGMRLTPPRGSPAR